MKYPKFIKKGDTIGVTAPSGGFVGDAPFYQLSNAIKKVEEYGYKIITTPNVYTEINGRSSDKMDRVKQLTELFINKEVSAIICARGGDFLIEMISLFNFNIVADNLKWIQGYSDPTSLLFILTTNYDIATIYGNNFGIFGMKNWHISLNYNFDILEGKTLIQNSFDKFENEKPEKLIGDEEYNLDTLVKWQNLNNEEEIKMTGRIIGGCLDVLIHLIGTKYDKTKEFINRYKDDGIIWYFDNFAINTDEIVTVMWQLQEAGWFVNTKGIIFGRNLTEYSAYDISFVDALKECLDIPIIINADIGHKPPRMTIINGAYAKVICSKGKGIIKFELKR